MSIYIVWLNTRQQVSPGRHRVWAISPTLFFQQNATGYPGVLRPGDRIFFTGPKHDIPRHGLPTCFALTVKIRLRTLSRSASCASRRCIIFPPVLAKLACTESRITDIRHRRARRVEPLSFLLLLLLFLPPSKPTPRSLWSMFALWYSEKNTPQCTVALFVHQLVWKMEFSPIQIDVPVYKKINYMRLESIDVSLVDRNWIKFEINAVFQVNWASK